MSTDNQALIAGLRKNSGPLPWGPDLFTRAADAIEAKAKEIAYLLTVPSNTEREHLKDRAKRAEQERDAYAAVIEAARIVIGTENAWDGHARADQLDNTRRVLNSAFTFDLAEHDRRVREEAVRLEGVTRITVVGTDGLMFERYAAFNGGVELHIQDEGRTLKVFPRRRGGEE